MKSKIKAAASGLLIFASAVEISGKGAWLMTGEYGEPKGNVLTMLVFCTAFAAAFCMLSDENVGEKSRCVPLILCAVFSAFTSDSPVVFFASALSLACVHGKIGVELPLFVLPVFLPGVTVLPPLCEALAAVVVPAIKAAAGLYGTSEEPSCGAFAAGMMSAALLFILL